MEHTASTHLALRYAEFGNPKQVLALAQTDLPRRAARSLRVRMIAAPINPSDLIPIWGAYKHLITPPMIAGYEGVGRVIDAPDSHADLVGQRVLPLRGAGTWQQVLDCDADIAVPVPGDVPTDLAARGYINPLTAQYLLREWPVRGKRVVLTGAGSFIAAILAQWARADGASEVIGIYRSAQRRAALEAMGVVPVHDSDTQAIQSIAASSRLVVDAVGGPMALSILNAMPEGGEFVGYGLLSGQSVFPNSATRANLRRFHLRDRLKDLSHPAWQQQFQTIWPRLMATQLPGVETFDLHDWQAALAAFDRPGRAGKPVLRFSQG
ncbi:zinc-dependent alcohol dehydrogenase family protein [Cognatishimia sp.]|uniref:zinc-dependent alcohol dehydrogenase family protein n=1 Tax=Cognatishimia sp. TaxID=2211648 RepID=UPI0035142ED4